MPRSSREFLAKSAEKWVDYAIPIELYAQTYIILKNKNWFYRQNFQSHWWIYGRVCKSQGNQTVIIVEKAKSAFHS